MLLTPICDKNLELAAKVGAEEIVSIFPGLEEGVLNSLKQKVDCFGMRLTYIERKFHMIRSFMDYPDVMIK